MTKTGRLTATLATLAIGATLTTGLANAAPAGQSAPERHLMTAVNDAREARGLAPLRFNRALARPARAHSIHLIRADTLDHDSANGQPFWTRLVAAGFPRNRWMGENLAMLPGCDLAAARATVRMWLGSPGHRANLLSPRFRYLGAGAASSDAGCSVTVFTADFGS